MGIVLGFVIGALLVCILAQFWVSRLKEKLIQSSNSNEKYLEELKKVSSQLLELDEKYNNQVNANRELIRQKSSQATKSGMYVETLSPLLSAFPVNIFDNNTTVKWIGDPVDYVAFSFEEPMITFIEVKSGDAGLSSRQKIIKKAIKDGLIRFVEVRLNSDGTTESKE